MKKSMLSTLALVAASMMFGAPQPPIQSKPAPAARHSSATTKPQKSMSKKKKSDKKAAEHQKSPAPATK